MKKNLLAMALAVCMLLALTACGTSESAASAEAQTPASAAESAASQEAAAPAPEPETSEEPAPVQEPEEAPEAEASAQEPAAEPEPEAEPEAEPEPEAAEEAPAEPVICTATFSDGQTFEATVGEDFVFFFQCNAPGDMGAPEEGQEGAGITVSDGSVAYSNVGLGGPFQYPTSELVTVSGFTGDFTVTITEAATNMGATYTVYTDPQEIEDAIAFAEAMAQAQAENPMP